MLQITDLIWKQDVVREFVRDYHLQSNAAFEEGKGGWVDVVSRVLCRDFMQPAPFFLFLSNHYLCNVLRFDQ